MAKPDKVSADVKIAQSSWVNDFKKVFGLVIFQNVDLAFEKLTLALQH